MKIRGLYCIIPEFNMISEYINFVSSLVKHHPSVVQLRIKKQSSRFFFSVAAKIKEILAQHKITFIINDRVDIALLVRCDGIHLGQDDLPADKVRKLVGKKMLIGVSTHSVVEAMKTIKLPVDYISIGPVFSTITKPERAPIGVETVEKVVKIVDKKLPVVAIGGINSQNIHLLKEANPDAIAVLSAIKTLDTKVIKQLKSIF
ncbi:MAG: thiamine phosphate synthase [Endomicrobia bacterium]|nr:thiamine phosphate synthase [Endomicrobiia bacterium]